MYLLFSENFLLRFGFTWTVLLYYIIIIYLHSAYCDIAPVYTSERCFDSILYLSWTGSSRQANATSVSLWLSGSLAAVGVNSFLCCICFCFSWNWLEVWCTLYTDTRTCALQSFLPTAVYGSTHVQPIYPCGIPCWCCCCVFDCLP